MSTYIFRMPDIGEGIVEAEVVAWHVTVGEAVEEDAPLAEVMTDKATVEITAPVGGTVASIGAEVGEKIVIGADFAVFETDASVAPSLSAPISSGEKSTPSAPGTIQAHTPKVISQPGGSAADNESDFSLLTDVDATLLIDEDDTSDVTALLADADGTLKIESADQIHFADKTGDENSTDRNNRSGSSSARTQNVTATAKTKRLASPAVRRRAREMGIDINTLTGSGPKGRIMHDDLTHSQNSLTPTNSEPNPTQSISSTVKTDKTGGTREIAITGLRRVIARRMASAKRSIPHFTYVEEIDVTNLEALRQHLNHRDNNKRPISLLHLLIPAVCRAVRDWPQCNAHYDAESEILTTYSAVHMGVAVMTDAGLMVPVIRNAGNLSVSSISVEVARLAEGARAKTLDRDELQGSTITISSLGKLAGIAATPILNAPETTIIGPNRVREAPVVQNGKVIVRKLMNVSASFDHRVVDGYDAASMVHRIKELLEQPALIFMPETD